MTKCDKCKKPLGDVNEYSDIMLALKDTLGPDDQYCYMFCEKCEIKKEKLIMAWTKKR